MNSDTQGTNEICKSFELNILKIKKIITIKNNPKPLSAVMSAEKCILEAKFHNLYRCGYNVLHNWIFA